MSTSPWERRTHSRLAGEGGRRLFAVLAAATVVGAVMAGLTASRERRGQPGAPGTPGTFHGPPPAVSRAGDGSTVVVWGDAAAPLLEIFTDYQCSACKAMESAAGPVIKRLAAQGRVRVVYRPFQSYWGASAEPRPSNSRRAANAALCAPARNWFAYHDALFAHQPPEGVRGFEPADLIALGERVGITDGAFQSCVTGARQAGGVDRMSRYAIAVRRVRKAPAVLLDGRPLDTEATLTDGARMERAVHAARHG